jgi:hypothetical protein
MNHTRKNLTPARVYLDGINPDAPVDAYVCEGEFWNGWACPYFTKEQAYVFAAMWHARFYKKTWSRKKLFTFDAANDIYSFFDPENEEIEAVKGADRLGPDGATIHVYAIGSHGWTWSIEEEKG